MKENSILFLVLLFLLLTSCTRGYKVEGGKVYYEYWNEGSGQGKLLIKEADAKTFEELNFDFEHNLEFGKDKNHLFIDGEVIKNIDPKTFRFIGHCIFRDKDSAYFFGFSNNINDYVIKGVNPNSIKLLKYPWAKADNILIYGSDTLNVNNVNDFIPIDEDWGKTKEHMINNTQILYDADLETFEIISSFEGKDKNYNYESGFIKEDDFKKITLKEFDFEKKEICENEPIAFIGIYDKLKSYEEDKNEKIEIVEKLKSKGFKVNNTKHLNWSGESKIIRVSMTNNKCNCVVEKLYRYDFSKPSETKEIFKVTERMHCN
ncbi:DKNYY domain-containing protein [Flavobacterium sp.]|uniref:DKNYY domain-containing protein n=1 Tax=Flavobacterium sp. TaxID=239 RepID=UPI00345C17C3